MVYSFFIFLLSDEITQNNNNKEDNSPKETSNKINLAETEKK